MTIFAETLDALFTDANIGRDAICRAGGTGAGVNVRVVFRAPDTAASFDGGRFVTTARFIDVRVSEIPVLTPGDTFEIGSTTYVVQGEPMRDDDNLIWSVEVRGA